MFIEGCKVPINMPVCICSELYMCRSSTHQTIFIEICPQLLQDSMFLISICPRLCAIRQRVIRLASFFFKIQEICGVAVSADSYFMKYVSDCYSKLQELWYKHLDNDDDLVEWYSGYEQCKVQKAQMKEMLMPIVWNSTRMQDWYMRRKRSSNCSYYSFVICFVLVLAWFLISALSLR